MIGILKFGSGRFAGTRIEGENVYLRPPGDGDWPAWAELRAASRDFLQRWEPTWPRDALTRASFRQRLRQYETERREGTGFTFFIFRRQDDALLGGITLSNIRRGVAQAGTLGYWIGKNHARKGYMTDALARVADHAFTQLNLHRLEAACQPDNVASRELLTNLGFVEEGRARMYLLIDGRWRDHLLFGLVREDFSVRPR